MLIIEEAPYDSSWMNNLFSIRSLNTKIDIEKWIYIL